MPSMFHLSKFLPHKNGASKKKLPQNDRDAAISPITSLPPELLAEIFAKCLVLPPLHSRRRVPDKRYSAPLVLCQVSHGWRTLALSTPALWIHLDVDLHRDTPIAETLMLCDLWFTNSGVLPLSLSLRVWDDPDMQKTKQLLHQWFTYMHRWKSCSMLHTTISKDGMPVTVDLPVAASLENLDFDIAGLLSADWASCIARSAAQLRELKWFGPVLEAPDQPYSHLMSMTITIYSNVSLSHYIRLLQYSPALQYLKVGLFRSAESSEPPVLLHRNLRQVEMKIWKESAPQLGQLMEHLTLTSLESLSVTYVGKSSDYNWPQSSFLEFLTRSGCALAELAVKNIRMTDFIPCLAHSGMRRLRTLDVNHLLLDSLTPNLAPALEVIHLRASDASQTAAIEAFVRGRAATLKELHLSLGRHAPSPEFSDWAKQMREDGLIIQVSTALD